MAKRIEDVDSLDLVAVLALINALCKLKDIRNMKHDVVYRNMKY
jgi:hypothetical protein